MARASLPRRPVPLETDQDGETCCVCEGETRAYILGGRQIDSKSHTKKKRERERERERTEGAALDGRKEERMEGRKGAREARERGRQGGPVGNK